MSKVNICAPLHPITSVEDIYYNGYERVNLRLFPNTTSDVLTISLPDNVLENHSMIIYDLLGIQVKKLVPVLSACGGTMIIDITNHPVSVYFVRIGCNVARFVKM